MTDRVTMRPAGPQDLSILRYWDGLPHIQASGGPEDDWEWETELGRAPWPDWRWWFMAEVGSRAVGFLAIIDPAREASHYWGADCPPNLRAIDIWIGEQSDHRRGLGRQMMAAALAHSFSDPDVAAVLTDPLAANADAHAFYQAMGFHPDGHRQFGPDDCLVHRITRAQWMAHPKRILPHAESLDRR